MARRKRSAQKAIVTRIAKVGNLRLNKCKLDELNLIAERCGILRSDIWNEYGSLKAWGVSEYVIGQQKRPTKDKYQLPAKLWEATLYDVIGNIHVVQASCIQKVLAKLNIYYQKVKSRKSSEQLLLESREWLKDSRLSRLVRSCWVRGYTHVSNQIVITEYNCLKDKNGVVWIKFSGLTKGKPLKIPTTLPAEIKGQIRLIKQENNWYIYYLVEIEIPPKKETGITIGIDRGYSEVYVTSNNDGNRFIGQDFGSIQSKESDYRNDKGIKRNKLRAIARKAKKKGNHLLADRIKNNNLGHQKWNRREKRFKGRVKTLVFTSTHQLMRDEIKTIAYEDLTEQFTSKNKRSKRVKRNLNSWCKGTVRDALKQVSARTGCTVAEVNACYTSQLDSRFGILKGAREGDEFIGFDGVVLQADCNAAENVLARLGDAEITLFTKHSIAKKILLERTRKFQACTQVTQETWDKVFEAISGKDKPQSRERLFPHKKRVNPTANPKQLTLFDFV